ncbi:MAG: YkgJ family cysteine cluster protein [Myxococcota bacterium]|nr:YkgJ family cysteine cluster protein [Myxococcota bacterium]
MRSPKELLKFRCTGCGNCCKEPLLPLTCADVIRIRESTGDDPMDFVRFVDEDAIDLEGEPEAFALLAQGKRVMILRHQGGGCRYLGEDLRCKIYESRPLGCRIFPFDPAFDKRGGLRRLKLIQATDCKYELDGGNDPDELRTLHQLYEAATALYQQKIAAWNREQQRRKRLGKRPQSSRRFLSYLGALSKG